MGKLYHGSSESGIKRLEPRKSTHGTYVYATPYKELAILFSRRCGDDMTCTLYREDYNEPWKIVERIPNGFDVMYSNSSSLYTLDDSTFKDINTGFAELVSDVGVDTLLEERITSVYEAIKQLEQQGKVEIYRYPNRPNSIPIDDSDLIEKEIKQSERNNKPISKNSFKRLIYLHPNLIPLVNNMLFELGLGVYDDSDVVDIFEEFLIKQILDPSHEQYIKSAVVSISNYYPNLIPMIQEKTTLLDKSKNEKINYVIDFISKKYPDIPEEFVKQAKNVYANDQRSFSEIGKEIREQISKIAISEEPTSKAVKP